LKEQISWIRWTGIMIIVLGIALVVLEPNGQKDVELSVSTSVEKVPGDNNKEG
jgi:drug/metabolite transporter (DMT)-like permease